MGGGTSRARQHGRGGPRTRGRCVPPCPVFHQASEGERDALWIECTRCETGQSTHINIALVGSMWRDGERTALAFVGGDGQRIEVTETPGTDHGACIGPLAQA